MKTQNKNLGILTLIASFATLSSTTAWSQSTQGPGEEKYGVKAAQGVDAAKLTAHLQLGVWHLYEVNTYTPEVYFDNSNDKARTTLPSSKVADYFAVPFPVLADQKKAKGIMDVALGYSLVPKSLEFLKDGTVKVNVAGEKVDPTSVEELQAPYLVMPAAKVKEDQVIHDIVLPIFVDSEHHVSGRIFMIDKNSMDKKANIDEFPGVPELNIVGPKLWISHVYKEKQTDENNKTSWVEIVEEYVYSLDADGPRKRSERQDVMDAAEAKEAAAQEKQNKK